MLPAPQAGLVISYAYLWHREFAAAQEEGTKDRPCGIVLTSKKSGDETVVSVAPITHSPQEDTDAVVPVPAATKARLGLDAADSWIVVSETNTFV